jgi:hypothetical protein
MVEALRPELEIGVPVFATEGPRAFMEKRAPRFKGKEESRRVYAALGPISWMRSMT